ncbi:prolipoprotein diacylglyceryl transferase [Candidatus Microgenomates bacterium]|nr:prolipoprotein diacylglyceryl transferase [Candidatus Microgenomates bacterium]
MYCLYRLVKDDYVFIRKNLSPELAFDLAFITLWSSLFFARLLALIANPINGENPIVAFLSLNKGGFSLLGAMFGALLALYLLAKSKKLPLGRLFDFFSLSGSISFSFGFGLSIVLVSGMERFILLGSAVVYLFLSLLYRFVLYPRLLNRSIKDGTISIIFLMLFSCVAIITALLPFLQKQVISLSIPLLLSGLFFIFSFILLITQARHLKKR